MGIAFSLQMLSRLLLILAIKHLLAGSDNGGHKCIDCIAKENEVLHTIPLHFQPPPLL